LACARFAAGCWAQPGAQPDIAKARHKPPQRNSPPARSIDARGPFGTRRVRCSFVNMAGTLTELKGPIKHTAPTGMC
jgi:hypothetical protein